ncbi:MAG: ankyrin repeat domain-containing protein [Waddliaceae bacterium]
MSVSPPPSSAGATIDTEDFTFIDPDESSKADGATQTHSLKSLLEEQVLLTLSLLGKNLEDLLAKASARGDTTSIEFFLKHRARETLSSSLSLETPFGIAANKGHKAACEIFLRHGENLHETNDKGQTRLHLAAMCEDTKALETLLSLGANVGAVDAKGRTALHIAVAYGLMRSAELLLGREADINASDHKDRTPLHIAVNNDNAELVAFLIGRHADLEKPNKEGKTPFQIACERDDPDVCPLFPDYKDPIKIVVDGIQRDLSELSTKVRETLAASEVQQTISDISRNVFQSIRTWTTGSETERTTDE